MLAQTPADWEAFAEEWTERQALTDQITREGNELPADFALTNAEMGTSWMAAMVVQEVGGYGLVQVLDAAGRFVAGGFSREQATQRARLVLAGAAR
jgi:hypothetical protein